MSEMLSKNHYRLRLCRLQMLPILSWTLLLLIMLQGCGAQSSGPPVGHGTIEVIHEGKPVSGLVAYLSDLPHGLQFELNADPQGRFDFKNVPTGTYQFSMATPLNFQSAPTGTTQVKAPTASVAHKIPKKYLAPNTTDITVTVNSGANELVKVDLK